VATKKSTPKKKTLKAVDSMSDAQAKRLLGKMNAALKEAGFDGRAQEVHFLPSKTPAPAVAAATSTIPCPPPKRIRRVCFRQPDGRIRCEDRCV